MDNRISFKANIKFISERKFKQLTLSISRNPNNPKYIRTQIDQVRKDQQCLMEDVFASIAGGVQPSQTPSKGVIFFHYSPKYFNPICSLRNDGEIIFPEIATEMNKKISKTQNSSGFITGGKYLINNGNLNLEISKKSEQLADEFRNYLQESGIAFSEFSGQKQEFGRTNVFYDGENTWYVNYKDCYAQDKTKQGAKNPVDYLKSIYKNIKIYNKDKIFIKGKKLNKKELRQLSEN